MCPKPSISTFVDDNFVIIKNQKGTLENEVNRAMEVLQNYMNSNLFSTQWRQNKNTDSIKEPGPKGQI